MKLPNFDVFEPFVDLRTKMKATDTVPLSLVDVTPRSPLHTAPVITAWQPLSPTSTNSQPKSQPSVPKIIEPIHPLPIAQPTSESPRVASAPPPRKPQRHQKRRITIPQILLVLALNAFLAALIALMMRDRATPIKQETPPPPAVKTTEPSPLPTPAASTPPVMPALKTTEPTSSPIESAPSEPTHAGTTLEVKDSKHTETPIEDKPFETPPAPPVEREIRASEILRESTPNFPLPAAPVPIPPTPKPPSEFDIDTVPFSDALRGAGQDWYIKVEKRKKQQRIEPEPESETPTPH